MPDRGGHIRLAGDEGVDDLADRLDTLGRTIVEQEERRTEPGRDYLEAVRRRGALSRGRRTWPWAAMAASVALGAGAVLVLSRSQTPPGGGGHTVAVDAGLADQHDQSVAGLTRINRSVATPDSLRLPGGSAVGAASGESTGVARAADSRRADRVEAIAGGK